MRAIPALEGKPKDESKSDEAPIDDTLGVGIDDRPIAQFTVKPGDGIANERRRRQ